MHSLKVQYLIMIVSSLNSAPVVPELMRLRDQHDPIVGSIPYSAWPEERVFYENLWSVCINSAETEEQMSTSTTNTERESKVGAGVSEYLSKWPLDGSSS